MECGVGLRLPPHSINLPASFNRTRLFPELVQVLDKRQHGAIEAFDVLVRGLDHIILVWRMGTAAVAKAKMPRCRFGGFAGKNVTRIGTGFSGQKHRLNTRTLKYCHLRLYEGSACDRAGWVITASDFDLDVAEPALRKMRFERSDC